MQILKAETGDTVQSALVSVSEQENVTKIFSLRKAVSLRAFLSWKLPEVTEAIKSQKSVALIVLAVSLETRKTTDVMLQRSFFAHLLDPPKLSAVSL